MQKLNYHEALITDQHYPCAVYCAKSHFHKEKDNTIPKNSIAFYLIQIITNPG